MGTLLATIALCLMLTAVAVACARTAGRYDAEVEQEHELSNAEVISILTRKV